MAVAIVVPSFVPGPKSIQIKGVVDPGDIIDMAAGYRDKITKIAPETGDLASNSRIDLDAEHVALVLQRSAVELVLGQDNCVDLVAVFAIEKGKNRNTAILMGLDAQGELLSDGSGRFGRAEETWPVKVRASSNEEFEEFFKKLLPPS